MSHDRAAASQLALEAEGQYKSGNAELAAATLDKALALDRGHARANWLQGNLSQDRGQLDRAITSYRRALRSDARLTEAHNDLGTAYFAKGWHTEAEQCYRLALQLEPQNIQATENLATVLRAQHRLTEARRAYVRVLKLRIARFLPRFLRGKPPPAPGAELPAGLQDVKMLQQQATALESAGKRGEAIALLERAVAAHLSSPELRVALGNLLADRREYGAALDRYQDALMLDPGCAPAKANIARVLHEVGRFREAEEVYRLSLEDEPDLAAARSSLAGTLISLGRYSDAENAAREALRLDPKSVHAHVMLASALLETGRTQEAKAAADAALLIDARDPELLRWLGIFVLLHRMDLAEAESLFRRAVASGPDRAHLHLSLARCLLIQGRFAEGWTEYEWRKREPARLRVYANFPYPEWDGSSLAGKSIVVNGEQGLGDEIMFASCLQEIAAQARRTVLYCNRRLEALFRRSFPDIEVVGGSHLTAAKDPFPVLEDVDCQVAGGTLPLHLRGTRERFPSHTRYLAPDDAKVQAWRARLEALGPGLKIGLSWKGGTPLSDMTRRTLRLEDLRRLLSVPGVHWVSIQHGDTAAERKRFPLNHWQEAMDDLDETAALVAALDLRIGVCNTQVHLAGAQGKEVWVMAPFSPDWRYGCKGASMPWYPAARMFRQAAYGDWASVIAGVSAALKQRAGA